MILSAGVLNAEPGVFGVTVQSVLTRLLRHDPKDTRSGHAHVAVMVE